IKPQNKKIMEARHEIKTWTLEIPYANTAGRNNAKKLGAKWDPERKVWTVKTSEYKLDLRNLWKFVKHDVEEAVVEDNAVAKRVFSKGRVDSGMGFYMADTPRNWDLVYKLGYDAIEFTN